MQCFIYFVFFVFDTIATYRYMPLSPGAKLQQQSNKEKFELARKLKYKVDKIRKIYWKDMRSELMKERQLAVAIYLINKLALRVGIEKDSGDGADTVRFESYSCFPCCLSFLYENPLTRWAAAPFW